MRPWLLFGIGLIALNASGQAPTGKLFADLKAKREMLPSLHQEFQVSQTFKTAHGNQAARRDIVLDISQNKWREQTVDGSDDRIRIFDGQDLFLMESQGDEYVRIKRKAKDDDPAPGPYGSVDLDLAKATELERQPCGFAKNDHACVIVQAPVRPWVRTERVGGDITRMSGGIARMAIDTETGMLVQSVVQEVIENDRSGYQMELTYSLKRMGYGAPPDAALFKLPESGVHEVKQLTPWNIARIKKQLVGKPAPELEVMDIQGNPVSLSTLKGKTVLLDFWTTWCPPCRADAPALDKLYNKYGDKGLAIVGLSVSEERGVVEKFLKDHPHSFPVVLTSENEMPRPYQIGAFPTYMVISPDGTLASAADGDQGFGELRKFLEKAGMPAD